MFIILLSLILLGLVALTAGIIRNRRLRSQLKAGEIDHLPQIHQVTDCGADECQLETQGHCQMDCSKLRARSDFEYFDDEELDRYKGRSSEAYSEEETEEFREVLYTMRPGEVGDWTVSLLSRGIALPDGIKDEVFLLLEENQPKTAANQGK